MVKGLKASFFLLFLATTLGSCKKLVEDKKRDLLLQIMTDGTWRVDGYNEGTVDVSAEFASYNFQFNENGTVVGIHDGTTEQGTWVGDVNNYSINSNFPTAVNPIKRLNGTWKITDSSNTTVEAEMNTANGKNFLHLVKNS